ncbi:MAG: beta-1,6-N-acetylglucosaminyltransferase [Alistipes sp.]|jgi:hypothetical protein|nr:beta-1,6-N-acetylglucosaminyltransferase [Alistipes sp.]
MRIAYLITAYSDFRHLERLVGALDDPRAGFLIHIDARSHVPEGVIERLTARGNVVFAPRRPVWWGGWSHVAAILSLMELAVDGDGGYDCCVILSGADYPIRPNDTIFETLAAGGQYINATPGFRPSKPESRVKYYRFDGFDRRNLHNPKTILLRGAETILRTLGIHKRKYPFTQIYSGIVWSALSAPCVRYILDYVRAHPGYTRFFRTAQVPEEMFFQTITGNSPFAAEIRHTPTYIDWDHPSASPPIITEQYLPLLATRPRLFARKFNDHSSPVLDLIDTQLRGIGHHGEMG